MFGELIRSHRRRLGLTQEELADRAGLGVRSIGKLEAGRTAFPRQATVRLLADALDLHGTDREEFVHAAAAPAPPPPAATGAPDDVPAQLPADVRGFSGRHDTLAQLDAMLAELPGRPAADPGRDPSTDLAPAPPRSSTAVVIGAVSGTAGVGKTTLVVHWAHRVRHRFPDGQLYLNLRGFDPAGTVMEPADALGRFLDVLKVPAGQVPATLDARAALYRSLLAGRRVLVILDNARDAEQVRPLLPGSPGCLVLVTSRGPLTSLVAGVGAHPVPLDLLTPAEAHELLAHRIGPDRAAAEPAAAERIVTACARLPLALALVAARAATHPRFTLDDLANELEDARTPLEILTDSDPRTDVRTVFSWSYHALSAPTAQLFRFLGLHPGLDVSAPAAASLVGLPLSRVRPQLHELDQAQLTVEHAPGRYSTHDLLRSYAGDTARDTHTASERREAIARMLDHYLHSAHAAATRVVPARSKLSLDPPLAGTSPERFDDEHQATAWLTTELAGLVDVIGLAAEAGFDRYAWQLGWTVSRFCELGSYWHDGAGVQRLALAAAERLGDVEAQALIHRSLARAYGWLGQYDDAEWHLHRSITICRARTDHLGEANGYGSLSWVLGLQNRHREALAAAESALELNRRASSQIGEANALNLVGWTWSQLGDHAQAITHCEQALELFEKLGDRFSTAHTQDSLGRAHHHLGRHAEALACFQRALDLYRGFGHRFFEAETLDHLGDTHHATGDAAAAGTAYDQALAILDDLGHPLADEIRAKLG